MNELRNLAANDLAWAAAREVQYREDGATVPEPIRRLKALSSKVVEQPVQALATPADGVNKSMLEAMRTELQKTREILGAIDDESPSAVADRVMRENERLTLGVREAASMLFNFIGDPRATPPVGSLAHTRMHVVDGEGPGSAVVAERTVNMPTHVTVSNPQPRDDGNPRIVAEFSPTPGARVPVKLAHGIVLTNRKEIPDLRRYLITEPTQGAFVAQCLDASGGLGPPAGTRDGIYFADSWGIDANPGEMKGERAPRWSEVPANDGGKATPLVKQPPLVDVGPATAAPVVPAKPKIGDWEPADEQIIGFAETLQLAMNKAAVSVVVDLAKTRELLARFKADKADVEVPKPGVSFYHYAVKALKG